VRSEKAPLRAWARLDKLDSAGLVAALDSPNGWQRDTAMMMLLWKNDPAAKEPLEKLIRESKNGLTRMQALCTLGAMAEVPQELLHRGIDDHEFGVRRHSIRLSEEQFKDGASKDVVGITEWNRRDSDINRQVWLQFAYSLAKASKDDLRGRKLEVL